MIKFAHMADIHLGYKQYGSDERAIDFAQAFMKAIKKAVAEKVDFIIIAGDLFHKKSEMDPLTLTQAIKVLEVAKKEKIPVIAVEGNHDSAYFKETFSWLDYLSQQGLIVNLKPRFEEDIVVEEWDGKSGAYIDLDIGVRIYGMKYYGSMTEKVLDMYSKKIKRLKNGLTIFTAHAGVEGYVKIYGCIPSTRFHKINADYIALGHIHKSFVEGKIHNPGSLEVCDITELKFKRGFFIVEWDKEVKSNLVEVKGREFLILDSELKSEEDVVNFKRKLSEVKIKRPVVYINIKCSRDIKKLLCDDEIKKILSNVSPIALKIKWEIFNEFTPIKSFKKEDIESYVISQILENYKYGDISEEIITLKNAFCGKFDLKRVDEFIESILFSEQRKKVSEKEVKEEVKSKTEKEIEKLEKEKEETEEDVWDWRKAYALRNKTRKH